MDDDKCLFCGAYVPEGRMICPICEELGNRSTEELIKRATEGEQE